MTNARHPDEELGDDELIQPAEVMLARIKKLQEDKELRAEIEALKKQGTVPPYAVEKGHSEYLEAKASPSRMTSPERFLAKVIAAGPPSVPVVDTVPDLPSVPTARVETDEQRDSNGAEQEGPPEALVTLPAAVSRTTKRTAPVQQQADVDTAISRRPKPRRRWALPIGILGASILAAAAYVIFPRGETPLVPLPVSARAQPSNSQVTSGVSAGIQPHPVPTATAASAESASASLPTATAPAATASADHPAMTSHASSALPATAPAPRPTASSNYDPGMWDLNTGGKR